MELGEYVDALKRKRKLLKRQVKAIKLEIDETKKEINYLHARERPPPRDPLSILNDEEWELIFRNLEDYPKDLLNLSKTSPQFERIIHKRLKQSQVDLQFELILPHMIPYLTYNDLENCYHALEKPSIPEWRLLCLLIAYFLRLSGGLGGYSHALRRAHWSKFHMSRSFVNILFSDCRNHGFLIVAAILLLILFIASTSLQSFSFIF